MQKISYQYIDGNFYMDFPAILIPESYKNELILKIQKKIESLESKYNRVLSLNFVDFYKNEDYDQHFLILSRHRNQKIQKYKIKVFPHK